MELWTVDTLITYFREESDLGCSYLTDDKGVTRRTAVPRQGCVRSRSVVAARAFPCPRGLARPRSMIRSIWPQEQFFTKLLDLRPFSNSEPIGLSDGFY